jgi:hypothetical protein
VSHELAGHFLAGQQVVGIQISMQPGAVEDFAAVQDEADGTLDELGGIDFVAAGPDANVATCPTEEGCEVVTGIAQPIKALMHIRLKCCSQHHYRKLLAPQAESHFEPALKHEPRWAGVLSEEPARFAEPTFYEPGEIEGEDTLDINKAPANRLAQEFEVSARQELLWLAFVAHIRDLSFP